MNGMAIGWFGAAAIGTAMFAALLDQTFRRRKAWDRPAWTRTAAYRRLFRPAWLLVLFAGLGLLAGESWRAAAAVAASLAGLALLRGRARSPSSVAARIEAGAMRIAADRPGISKDEARVAAILERHPEWGIELAERIVADAADADSIGRVVARMERGWPGG